MLGWCWEYYTDAIHMVNMCFACPFIYIGKSILKQDKQAWYNTIGVNYIVLLQYSKVE